MKWLIPIGVIIGLTAAVIIRHGPFADSIKPAKPSIPVVKPPVVAPLPPLDPKAFKDDAWRKAIERIEAADRQAQQQIEQSLQLLREFFAQAKRGSRPFAGELLGLKGKWLLVKSKFTGSQRNEHADFLVAKFGEYILKGEDVEKALKAVVEAHLSQLDGMDNQLLVDVRADIEGLRPDAALAISAVQTEAAFRDAFRTSRDHVTPLLQKDLPRFVAQEIVSYAGGEIAAKLAVRVAAGIATRMGISAGILSSGAVAGVGTFGLSIVAGLVVDAIIDKMLKQTGHDPEGQIAQRVNAALDGLRDSLIDGHPEALGVYATAKKIVQETNSVELGREADATIDVIEASGALGLKRDLRLYTEARCRQRRAALEFLIRGPSPTSNKGDFHAPDFRFPGYGVCLRNGL